MLPALLAVALACLQLLAVGYAKVLAGTAAEAGALALAAGADPRARRPRGPARLGAGANADRRGRRPGGSEAAAAGGAARAGRQARGRGPRDGGAVRALRASPGPRGLAGAALSAAGSWLLEPADPEAVPTTRVAGPRPVIAVFGLAPGCGTTMVARALAAELAARDPAGAAAVSCELPGSGMAVATPAATRLARSLADVPGAATRAVGRALPGRRGRCAGARRLRAPLRPAGARCRLGGAGRDRRRPGRLHGPGRVRRHRAGAGPGRGRLPRPGRA